MRVPVFITCKVYIEKCYTRGPWVPDTRIVHAVESRAQFHSGNNIHAGTGTWTGPRTWLTHLPWSINLPGSGYHCFPLPSTCVTQGTSPGMTHGVCTGTGTAPQY